MLGGNLGLLLYGDVSVMIHQLGGNKSVDQPTQGVQHMRFLRSTFSLFVIKTAKTSGNDYNLLLIDVM